MITINQIQSQNLQISYRAFIGDKEVGAIEATISSTGKHAILTVLEVMESYARNGIGRMLINRMAEELAKNKIDKLYVTAGGTIYLIYGPRKKEMTYEENISFYENVGFIHIDSINGNMMLNLIKAERKN